MTEKSKLFSQVHLEIYLNSIKRGFWWATLQYVFCFTSIYVLFSTWLWLLHRNRWTLRPKFKYIFQFWKKPFSRHPMVLNSLWNGNAARLVWWKTDIILFLNQCPQSKTVRLCMLSNMIQTAIESSKSFPWRRSEMTSASISNPLILFLYQNLPFFFCRGFCLGFFYFYFFSGTFSLSLSISPFIWNYLNFGFSLFRSHDFGLILG